MSIIEYTLNTQFAENSSLSKPAWLVSNPTENISGVRVKSMEMVNSFNVIDTRNNQISFTENTNSSLVCTFPTGNIYPPTFPATFAQCLSSIGTLTYTGIYNTTSNTMSISTNNSANNITFNSVGNSIYYEAGLLSNQNIKMSTNFTSGYIDLSGVKVVNMNCNEFYKTALVLGSNQNCIASVPIGVNFGYVFSYQNPSNAFITCELQNLGKISLTLFDEFYRSLTVNSPWQMSLQLQLKS